MASELRTGCPGIYIGPMVVIFSWVYVMVVLADMGLSYLTATGILLTRHVPGTNSYPTVTCDRATGPLSKPGILTAWGNVRLP